MHTRHINISRRSLGNRISLIVLAAFSLFLQACGGSAGHVTQPYRAGDVGAAQADPNAMSAGEEIPADNSLPQVKVAILLPLSGNNAALGEAMLKASQMALFDLGHSNFEIIPKDTGETEQGGRAAATEAINEGAQLILGPVFADSVRGAQSVIAGKNINMVSFSTDWTLANGQTYLIGFLPFDQVERVVQYARARGLQRFGVLTPDDDYGNAVINAYQQTAKQQGITGTRLERFSPRAADLSIMVRDFSDFDKRQSMGDSLGTPFDAVLIPAGGGLARSLGSFMNHYGLPPDQVRRLGTGLLDDTRLARDPGLAGAWFAAPPPKTRIDFENRFRRYYAQTPPRLASLAYDATALAATLSRMSLQQKGQVDFSRSALMNPNGFAGVDGIFRFRKDGIAERGLSVLEYRDGRIIEIDPAPRTFQVKSQ